ncbi:hypothetical protein KI387_005317, partial [Taxus chinensis]
MGYVEINKEEKYVTPPEPMVDGCNDEIKVFSFPFEEEESFHDEEIKARSFEAFEAEAPLEKGVIKCSNSQDDE